MAEDKPNATQSCAEVTENKAASCNITQPKEEKESDTNTIEESQKYNQDVQQVGNQAQGEGEHKECCKDQGLTNQKKGNTEQNEDVVQKNNGQEEKKSELTENDVEKEDDYTDPVDNKCQGEKNDKPEEKNIAVDGMTAQSEKEKSQEEEKQGHSKSEEESCKEPCPENEKREKQDEDMEGKQREKGQEQEEYTGERGGKKSEVTIDNLEDRVVNIEQVEKNENQGEKNDKLEENNIQADEATAACEKEKSQVDEKATEPRDQSIINNVKEGENDVELDVQNGGKGKDRSDKQAETTEADQQEPRTAKKKKKFRFFKKKRKYITIKTGKTQGTHEEFLNLLHRQKATLIHVDKEKEFKFIMVFCPVVSRAGTDIEAALRELNKISDAKPAVLVVLHCTNDPECVVPESSRTVSRDKMITADFLFSEDCGLHKCEKNIVAMCKVVKWLKSKPWR